MGIAIAAGSLALGLLSLLEGLLLVESGLGETKGDLVGGQLVVAVGDGGESGLHGLPVEWVKEHLLGLLAINVNSHTSASDVRWEALTIIKQINSRSLILII